MELEFVSTILAQLDPDFWGVPPTNFKSRRASQASGPFYVSSWRPQQLNVGFTLRDLGTIDCGRQLKDSGCH